MREFTCLKTCGCDGFDLVVLASQPGSWPGPASGWTALLLREWCQKLGKYEHNSVYYLFFLVKKKTPLSFVLTITTNEKFLFVLYFIKVSKKIFGDNSAKKQERVYLPISASWSLCSCQVSTHVQWVWWRGGLHYSNPPRVGLFLQRDVLSWTSPYWPHALERSSCIWGAVSDESSDWCVTIAAAVVVSRYLDPGTRWSRIYLFAMFQNVAGLVHLHFRQLKIRYNFRKVKEIQTPELSLYIYI